MCRGYINLVYMRDDKIITHPHTPGHNEILAEHGYNTGYGARIEWSIVNRDWAYAGKEFDLDPDQKMRLNDYIAERTDTVENFITWLLNEGKHCDDTLYLMFSTQRLKDDIAYACNLYRRKIRDIKTDVMSEYPFSTLWKTKYARLENQYYTKRVKVTQAEAEAIITATSALYASKTSLETEATIEAYKQGAKLQSLLNAEWGKYQPKVQALHDKLIVACKQVDKEDIPTSEKASKLTGIRSDYDKSITTLKSKTEKAAADIVAKNRWAGSPKAKNISERLVKITNDIYQETEKVKKAYEDKLTKLDATYEKERTKLKDEHKVEVDAWKKQASKIPNIDMSDVYWCEYVDIFAKAFKDPKNRTSAWKDVPLNPEENRQRIADEIAKLQKQLSSLPPSKAPKEEKEAESSLLGAANRAKAKDELRKAGIKSQYI